MSGSNISVTVCYVLLLIFPAFCSVSDPNLQDVLTALEKMIGYYRQTHKEMNLDGIYGLRVLEGQLEMLIREYQEGRHQHVGLPVFTKLQTLHNEARNVCRESLPYLQQDDPEYFDLFKPLVDHPMRIAKPYRRIDPRLTWNATVKPQQPSDFNEQFSDQCMGELMGTERLDSQKCVISKECVHAMTSRGSSEYQLTHQLLYTELAEESGCTNVLDKWLRSLGFVGGMSHMQLEFCTNNFYEVKAQINDLKGNIIPVYQDLFMEQEFVCPSLGFMEFLHKDWLRQILSWQRSNGCYGHMPRSSFNKNLNIDNSESDYEYDEKDEEDRDETKEQVQQNMRNAVPINQLNQNVLHNHVNQMDQRQIYQNQLQNVLRNDHGNSAQAVVVQQAGKQGNVLRMHINMINETKPQRLDPNIHLMRQKEGQLMQEADNLKAKAGGVGTQMKRDFNQQGGGSVQQVGDLGQFNHQSDSDNLGQQNSKVYPITGAANIQDAGIEIQNPSSLHQGTFLAQHQNQELAGRGNMEQQLKTDFHNAHLNPKFSGILQNQKQIVPNNQNFQMANNRLELNQHTVPLQANVDIKVQPDQARRQQGVNQQRKLLGLSRGSEYHLASRKNRHLLVEKRLDGGCLSHKTAVAAGALSQYLRFLINPGSTAYQTVIQFSGSNLMFIDKSRNGNIPKQKQIQPVPADDTRDLHLQGDNILGQKMVIDKPHLNQGLQEVEERPRKKEDVDEKNAERHLNTRDEAGAVPGVGNDEEDYYPQDHPHDLGQDDRDEDEGGAADLGHLLRNFPQNAGNDEGGNGILDNNQFQGHQDYDRDEQYIDDNNNEDHDQVKIRRRGPAHPLLPNNHPVNGIGQDSHANHDEGNYNYYGDRDHGDSHENIDQEDNDIKDYKKLEPTNSLIMGSKLRPHGASDGVGLPISLGRMYIVIVAVMLSLLFLIYRFVKTRRVVIRYVCRR